MTTADLAPAEQLSAEAFLDVDRRTLPGSWPVPERRAGSRAATWIARTAHFLATDPGGCWVAEVDEQMAGFATSAVREKLWVLATYAVRPDLQGAGIGTPLLASALHHGRGCLRGMVSSSADPRAVRRYRHAGFSLHPQMFLRGTVDRSVLPVVEKVREGSDADIDLMDSLDRRARGAAHGVDHAFMLSRWRLLVSDTTTGSGYAYVDDGGGLAVLAADNRLAASRLLWTVLADGPAHTTVPHLTAANEWAIDVGLAARLDLHTAGYLALRGMAPPAPYVHNGALL